MLDSELIFRTESRYKVDEIIPEMLGTFEVLLYFFFEVGFVLIEIEILKDQSTKEKFIFLFRVNN